MSTFTLKLALIFAVLYYSASAQKSAKQNAGLLTYEAKQGKLLAGATITGAGKIVALNSPGDGLQINNLAASSNLGIKYSSLGVGLVNVAINGSLVQKVNIHSTGDLNRSFLTAIIHVNIPAKATIAITLASKDVSIYIDKIIVGDGLKQNKDIWNLPQLPIALGPYAADWHSLAKKYLAPDWWREAKFGAWSHWDPQSMPEMGDWYARKMYQENSPVYKFHVKTFGHPSEYGYKDIAHNWIIDKWDPETLMNLYVQMGARYFMAMGVHHDNFDNWNSTYQPWNSVNVGPKRDIVAIWEKITHKHGLRFGIGFIIHRQEHGDSLCR